MTNKAISVSLAKIDYDLGQPYIKIIAHCPLDYEITMFQINVNMIEHGQWITKYYDASTSVAGLNNLIINFPVSALDGVVGPAIYEIYLKAENLNIPDEIEDKLVLSDVQYVYRNLLDGLLESDKCEGLSDELIKQYLILYGHQQAIHDGDLDVAKELFKLLHKNLTKCGNNTRRISCNCYDKHR